MLIGELSTKTGISRDTIRFYEKKGLIRLKKQHRLANNYKDYPDEIVEILMFIKRAKSFGFRLDEIKYWLEDWKEGRVPVDQKITVFEQRVGLVAERIEELQQLKAMLEAKLTDYKQLLQKQKG
ncbi:hypothetical protein BKI52_09915 [marine bacterium AO1-C]|nr:hypothetical protein BKI52_09915 [marine bacterium AO1-C]